MHRVVLVCVCKCAHIYIYIYMYIYHIRNAHANDPHRRVRVSKVPIAEDKHWKSQEAVLIRVRGTVAPANESRAFPKTPPSAVGKHLK